MGGDDSIHPFVIHCSYASEKCNSPQTPPIVTASAAISTARTMEGLQGGMQEVVCFVKDARPRELRRSCE
jgi:hypothetical protein